MTKRFFPKPRAVVKASALEIGANKSWAEIKLICGHCGKMTVETAMHSVTAPEECGLSIEEQDESWLATTGETQVCRRCNVLNVATDVEDFLRRRREGEAEFDELTKDFFNDLEFPE